MVFSVLVPLPLPACDLKRRPRLSLAADQRKLRIRRRLSQESRPWLLEIEVEMTIPDPDAVLSSSEGFLVDRADGGEIGVVDGIETAPDGTVQALLVAGGWFGRHRARIPVEAIEEITPADRRIIVRD